MFETMFWKSNKKGKFSILLLALLLVYVSYFWPKPSFSKRVNPGSHSPLVRGSLARLGYGKNDFPLRSDLWTEKIHLCIMFNLANLANEENINILTSYYFPFFKNITLIFDGHPNYNFSSVPDFVNVLLCNSNWAWYQHKCIRKCIQHNNSETEGHLYIADDMFINITKMAELDKSKIWFIVNEKKSMSWIQNPGPKGWGWQWWGPPHGNNVKLNNTIQSFPSKWKDNLEKYHGFPDNFSVVATSDIVYIPRTAVSKILPVSGSHHPARGPVLWDRHPPGCQCGLTWLCQDGIRLLVGRQKCGGDKTCIEDCSFCASCQTGVGWACCFMGRLYGTTAEQNYTRKQGKNPRWIVIGLFCQSG